MSKMYRYHPALQGILREHIIDKIQNNLFLLKIPRIYLLSIHGWNRKNKDQHNGQKMIEFNV